MSKLSLIRYSETKQFNGSTTGLLFLDGVFQCYTLEDEYREEKVMRETRIPNGEYKLSIANWGSLDSRYATRWPETHKGMLMLNDVPGFSGILIHCGASEKDTEGCILLGDSINNNQVTPAVLSYSWDAYLRVYKKIITKLLEKEEVTIGISDLPPQLS
jgi:hypothetical protein